MLSVNLAESQSAATRPIELPPAEPVAAAKKNCPLQRMVGFVVTTWVDIDRRAALERSLHPGIDRRASQILLVSAVVLTCVFFFGKPSFFDSLFGPALARSTRFGSYRQLIGLTYWCTTRLLLLALVPFVHLRLLGARLSDYGLTSGSARPESSALATTPDAPPRVFLKLYVVMALAVLPVVILMSFSASFQNVYPLHRQAGRSLFEFLFWETQYLATFFAVEFFFRGYLLFGLRRAFGSQAIFVAMLPYCMFHFTKPPAEALASIVAGLVLGTMAMATRSIWGGVLLHMAVALTMDLSALLQRHELLDLWARLPT